MAKSEGCDSPTYDKGLIQFAIGKKSEIQLVKTINLELKGGDKIETRILVVSSFRFFILTPNTKSPYKLEFSVHILDIHAIESKKPEQVVIKYGEKQAKFCLTKAGSANNVIGQLIANTKINFPGGNLDESLRKDIAPSDKLETINNIVNKLTSSESLIEAGPCGTFSRSYACICDHYGVPFLEEVAWDIDTIYLSHDTKEFNIQDFDHLEPRELVPVIATLEYNAWFTKLVCVSYKLSAEIQEVIAKVIKRSTTIEELILDGVSLGREFCQKLATALTSNPKSALEKIDLSSNLSAEDRGITHLAGGFSKLSHGLASLNLHETGITNKGASTIGQMLKNSKYMSTSLTRLNLSNNLLKVDGVTVICDFLAQANALTHLDLSSTECSVEQIFGALIRGCCQNLAFLNLSGNPFTTRKGKDTNLPASFQQFFSSTAALREINLSESRLPGDAARAMCLGLIENNVVQEVDINISKNELKTAGIRALTGPLSQITNLRCLDLSDNGFESDLIPLCESLCKNTSIKKLYIGQNCNKSRNLNNIVESLIKLISTENSPIQLLSLADSRLKHSITLLFDSLGTNESLTELDISGNMMGDEGARMLAKALQINNKLRTIHWDRNNVTQNGLRDIALALENNLTLQSMPIPITDVALCLKPATEKALKQIDKCLSRNQSPSQAVTEQAYRLQQGLMMASSQQQMVDKLIVQLQDTARVVRNSSDETVKVELRDAHRCINDADKLKQLFLKFHMCTSYKSMEERISSLAGDIYNSIQQQMKENVEKILDCAESNCPFVTGKEGVKESLNVACEGKTNISKAFIDTVVLQQLAPVILNEVSEKNLNLSSIVADTMMDKVIAQLEEHQAKLDLLLKEHQTSTGEKSAEIEENGDNISEAAQKAKNRLSAVQHRRSMRFPDDENDVLTSPSHHKRRPTVSRKRKPSDVEDQVDGDRDGAKKKEEAVATIDGAASKELVHYTKNRAPPARGRRPPTRPSAQQTRPSAQQSIRVGPEIQVDSVDDGLESFFTNAPMRPHSAVMTSNVVREPVPKSASLSQRGHSGSKKKNDKPSSLFPSAFRLEAKRLPFITVMGTDDRTKAKDKEAAEDNHKEPPEKKKHGILGIFKKNRDKKSPTAPRKQDSKNKEHRKSMEDLIDGKPENKRERKSSETKAKPVEELPAKPVAKRLPDRPQKPETAASNDQEKSAKPEAKLPPKTSEPISAASKKKGEAGEKNEKIEKEEEKEKEKEEKEKEEKEKEEKEKKEKEKEEKEKEEKEKEEKVKEEKEKEEKVKEEKVKEEKEQEVEKDKEKGKEDEEKTEAEASSHSAAASGEAENAKPQPKAPPKFGVGLAGGGDLLAEMKKRQEKNNGKKSPEPKPRPRVGTSPDVHRPDIHRPAVPVRPSSTKRAMKAKSATDMVAPGELDSKPLPKPRARDGKANEASSEQNKTKEVTTKNDGGDSSKPVPAKPTPKERPTVPSRPNVPKRPPSIVRNRANSQKDPKGKEVAAEVPAIDETKDRNGKTEQQPADDKSGNNQSQEKTPSEKPPEKLPAEKKPDVLPPDKESEKPPSEKGPEVPTKDVSTKEPSVKEPYTKEPTANETPTEKPADDSKPSESASAIESPEEKNESVGNKPEEGETDKPEVDGGNDKPKDGNDNETDISDKSKTSAGTEEPAPSEGITAEVNGDNVIKSSVDVDALAEAIKSSKDTSL